MRIHRHRWWESPQHRWLKLGSFLLIVGMIAIGFTMLSQWIWPVG